MNLYPSIDLRGGNCVRLLQGDFAREIVYGDDPVSIAKRFAAAGTPWIHVVDLDAVRGEGSNRDLVVRIIEAVETPVQVGGGVRDDDLLRAGAARVVVGSRAVEDPGWLHDLAAAHPGRVAVGLDHREGEVRVRGWEQGTGMALGDAVDAFAVPGVAVFVVTAIARDGLLEGPDVEGYRTLLRDARIPVIASGGVGSLADLRSLAALEVAGRRLEGAIAGRAIYEGNFTVEEALAACRP